MVKKTPGSLALFVLFSVSIAVSGCYRHIPVNPTEITKLNTPSKDSTKDEGTKDRARQNVILEQPNGEAYEVSRTSDVVVVTKDRNSVRFEHPTCAEIDDKSLVIDSKNHGEKSFDREEVASVQVRHPDIQKKTFIRAITYPTAGAAGLFLVGALIFGGVVGAPCC